MIDTSSTQYFIAGWAVVLGSIWALSKYEGTRTLLYYLFWLGVVLDLVSHSEELYYFYSIIFNLSGQATPITDIVGGNPTGSAPGSGTVEQQPGSGTGPVNNPGNYGPVKTLPGGRPVVSLPSIIENYIF